MRKKYHFRHLRSDESVRRYAWPLTRIKNALHHTLCYSDKKLFGGGYKKSKFNKMSKLLKLAKKNYLAVALKKNTRKVIGFFSGVMRKNELHVHIFCIDEQFRNLGIGSAFFMEAVRSAQATKFGGKKMLITLIRANNDSEQFYKRLKFRNTAEEQKMELVLPAQSNKGKTAHSSNKKRTHVRTPRCSPRGYLVSKWTSLA